MDTTMIRISKPAPIPVMSIASLIFAAVAAKVRATIEAQAPIGYEDESGFHYGEQEMNR